MIQKTTWATGDLIGCKIADKITNVTKNSWQNNLKKTVTNEHNKEIPKKRYISPAERKEMIDELRLK